MFTSNLKTGKLINNTAMVRKYIQADVNLLAAPTFDYITHISDHF